RFFDTNVLLYLISADAAKSSAAEALLIRGGVISVQVLNEFASVASRKSKMAYTEIQDVLSVVRHFCRIEPLTLETHDLGLAYFGRFGYSIYDAMILAAATLADCDELLSEDLHADQAISGDLVIRNPFTAS
ncbi:MAG: PIN domain-containing protein, partial [Gammaproteobacteria bacterium]|nr:PIN domain-containing protein [Gammaproteobacteria bacterium]